MTESEMMEKWCPFARIPSIELSGSYNRTTDGEIPDESLCVGRKCNAFGSSFSLNNTDRQRSFYCKLMK